MSSKLFRKSLAVFLAVIMIIMLVPVVAGAAPITTPLVFDDVTPSADNLAAEGWAWDLATLTLQLQDFQLTVLDDHAIVLPPGSTLELLGSAEIISTGDYFAAVAITGTGSAEPLTVRGTGSLTITVEAGSGIFADTDIGVNIESGTLTITTQNGEAIESYGAVEVSGGILSLSASGAGITSYDAIAISGDAEITVSSSFTGIYADGDVTISGGVLNLTSSDTGVKGSTITIDGSADLTILSGSFGIWGSSVVIIEGEASLDIDAAIAGVYVTFGDLTISGGTVNIHSLGYALKAGDGETLGNIVISGGDIVIVTDGSDAIWAVGNTYSGYGNLTISGDGSGDVRTGEGFLAVRAFDLTEPGATVEGSLDGIAYTTPVFVVEILGEDEAPTGYYTFADENGNFYPYIRWPAAPAQYAITVNSEGDGTASADVTNAAAGETVTLTAVPDDAGTKLSEWRVDVGTLTITKTDENTATFTMPAQAVTITAVFEALEEGANVITVTATGDGTASSDVRSALPDTVISLTATPNTGSRFVRWEVVSGTITLSNSTTAAATFSMPDTAVTVRAVFELLGGDGGTGGNGGGNGGSGNGNVGGGGETEVDGASDGEDEAYVPEADAGFHDWFVQGYPDGSFRPNAPMTRAEVAQMFFNLLGGGNTDLGAVTFQFPIESPRGIWYEQALRTIFALGIMQGDPDGRLRPQDFVTRAEFVAMTARFVKVMPAIASGQQFSDVPETHWASGYISAALVLGWIEGYGDGTFRPGNSISRAEVVTITNRVLGRVADRVFIGSHPNLHRFPDVPETHWAFYDIMEASIPHQYMQEVREHWDEVARD